MTSPIPPPTLPTPTHTPAAPHCKQTHPSSSLSLSHLQLAPQLVALPAQRLERALVPAPRARVEAARAAALERAVRLEERAVDRHDLAARVRGERERARLGVRVADERRPAREGEGALVGRVELDEVERELRGACLYSD